MALFGNKNKGQEYVDITLDEYYGQGEIYLASFLKKVLVQATSYGFNPDKIKYNVAKNPKSEAIEVNLIDHVIWTLLGVGTRNLDPRGIGSNSYIPLTVFFTNYKDDLTWFMSKQAIKINKQEVSTKKITTSYDASSINILRFLFALKSLCLRAITTTLVANNTINYRVNGLRSYEKREAQGIADDIKDTKEKSKEFGSWIITDSQDEIVGLNINADNVIAIQDTVNKLISFTTGFPLSYINGENTHGMNASGENEILAIHESLNFFYSTYLKPILDEVEIDVEVFANPSVYVMLGFDNEVFVAMNNAKMTYDSWENVPRQIKEKYEKLIIGDDYEYEETSNVDNDEDLLDGNK